MTITEDWSPGLKTWRKGKSKLSKQEVNDLYMKSVMRSAATRAKKKPISLAPVKGA